MTTLMPELDASTAMRHPTSAARGACTTAPRATATSPPAASTWRRRCTRRWPGMRW